MKKLLVILFVFLLCGVSLYAQQTRVPQPTPNSVLDAETEQSIQRANDINRRSQNLRLTENFPVKNENDRKIFLAKIQPLYRETTDEEMKVLAPNSEDSSKYAEFLRKKKTGLIKLISDKGCASNNKVINSSPECAKYAMPGAASAYSFRFGDYRILDLSDLNFRKNRFESLGVLTHGFLVNLGDVPLEQVTLNTKGVKYLAKLKPANDFNKAAEIAKKLTQGIKDEGFTYASIIPAEENATYVLRAIAYRGEALKTVDGIIYNEMDVDKREDIIIAFRVVRLNSNEDVTILFQELDSNKSPKLKPNQ
jgi:hypothetical protein